MLFTIYVVSQTRHIDTESFNKCPPNPHWVPGLLSVEQGGHLQGGPKRVRDERLVKEAIWDFSRVV